MKLFKPSPVFQRFPQKTSLNFKVMGINYKKDSLESIAIINKTYLLNDEKLLKTGKKQVYKYHFKDISLSMIDEPDNPKDKNAVKILANNIHIGYVPADLCLEVKHYISIGRIKTANITIHGGDYKESKNGIIALLNEPYYAEVYINLK